MSEPISKPKERYVWTKHSEFKMRQYRLSESLVKRVIRYPKRIEESIVPDTIAVMRPAPSKKYSEIWAMYAPIRSASSGQARGQLRIITAWRYPGESPSRDPIPQEILDEVRNIIF